MLGMTVYLFPAVTCRETEGFRLYRNLEGVSCGILRRESDSIVQHKERGEKNAENDGGGRPGRHEQCEQH